MGDTVSPSVCSVGEQGAKSFEDLNTQLKTSMTSSFRNNKTKIVYLLYLLKKLLL